MERKSKNNEEMEDQKDKNSGSAVNSLLNPETRLRDGKPSFEGLKNEPCGLMLLPLASPNFQTLGTISFITEKATREYREVWQPPLKHGNVLVMQARPPRASLLILQFFEIVIKGTFQNLFEVTNRGRADFSQIIPCECNDKFLILENILRSGGFQFFTFQTCQGKAHLSTGSLTKPISIEEINQLDALVKKMGSFKDAISDLMSRLIGENERDDTGTATGTDVMQTDRKFLNELNEQRSQYREAERQFTALKDKWCAIARTEMNGRHDKKSHNRNLGLYNITRNGTDEHLNYTTSPPPREGESSSRAELRPQSYDLGNKSIPVNRCYSLPALLRCISDRFLLIDWVNLRLFISPYLPEGVLQSIRNEAKLFQELVDRGLISYESLDFIRNALFEIGRVDLVHLIDCIQEGDYSLLKEQQTSERRNGLQDATVNNGLPSPPLQQMQNLFFENNPDIFSGTANSRSPVTVMSANAAGQLSRDNSLIQRNYIGSPRGSQTSTGFPIQENVSEVAAGSTRGETSASHEYSTNDSESRAVVQPEGQDTNSSTGDQPFGDAHTWIENPQVSCEHYDRFCDVQFSCCERFWPCHRCHNSESSCGTRKLRSRDIKKIKCKRCGKIQEFPKQAPNCVECNLKFAEYFCAICQHLTGTQNHPFHCEKCGICRVHGERSFHCDVCGVCLDINLQGNHRCRAGSAHDECCICFEDAFTGCQILPCSHKVHKDCATLMLRNGITKCPICRESFAHRLERRPTP